MQGVIAFDGGNRHRWLPDASRFVRFELEPGVHVIRYGPAMLVQLLAGSVDRPLAGFTDSIKVDCRAGDSHTYALSFRSGGELKSDALAPATASRELESRLIVTDADPGGPEL
jgi:hypothetical protein